jgi:hydrogenase nickel incorporation protein HypA/HybF
MHELAITQSIVDACSERAGEARVSRVVVEVGCLSGVSVEALRFCYDVCAAGTALDGSTLAIVEIAGRARCRSCSKRFTVNDYLAVCACGCADLEFTTGDELRVKHMEVQ